MVSDASLIIIDNIEHVYSYRRRFNLGTDSALLILICNQFGLELGESTELEKNITDFDVFST